MFIKQRIMAHEALKHIMLDNDHAPLFDHTTRLIYNTVKTAETDEGFANELDCECADFFDEQTAEGFDDVLDLFSHPNGELRNLLKRHEIITEA